MTPRHPSTTRQNPCRVVKPRVQSPAMNKQKAAAFLGTKENPVSERTVERFAAQGKIRKITVRRKSKSDGRARNTVDYNDDDLRALKTELAQPKAQPQVMRENTALQQTTTHALAPMQAADVIEQMAVRIGTEIVAATHAAAVVRMLTFEQAETEYNISRHQLKRAIRAGQLRALPLGKHGARLIKSDEIEAFIKSL